MLGVARLLVVVVHDTDPPARLGDWLRDAGLELDERHLGAGDALPADLDRLRRAAGARRPAVGAGRRGRAPELVARPRPAARRRSPPTSRRWRSAWAPSCWPRSAAGGARVGVDGPGGRRARWWPSATPPTPTRCSARCRSRPTCCSGTTTRSPSCRPARRCWPATRCYANQAFRVGRHVYGLQFHIETDAGDHPAVGRATTRSASPPAPHDRRDDLPARSDAAARRPAPRSWAPFAGRFADLVRARARRGAPEPR